MARIGINYDDVKHTAIHLLSQGIAPSVQKVREKLGTGSNTTIAEHLNLWREEYSTKEIHHLPTSIPKELIPAIEVLWQTAMEQATDQLAVTKTDLNEQQKSLQNERQVMALKTAYLENCIQEHQQLVSNKESQLQALETEYAIVQERLARQSEELEQLRQQHEKRLKQVYDEKYLAQEQVTQAQAEIRQYQQQFHEQTEKHQTAMAFERQRGEEYENRWLIQIDQVKQEAKEITKKYEAYRNSSDNDLQILNFKLAESQKELSKKMLQAEEKTVVCKQLSSKNLDIEAELFSSTLIYEYNLNDNKTVANGIKQELLEKYKKYKNKLDSKFLKEISTFDTKKINSSLWEMIILDHFSKFKNIIDHKDDGPDWKININEKEYFIEATCAHLSEGNSPEIKRVLEEMNTKGITTSDGKLINEVKLRITNVIDGKLKSHAQFMADKKCGYILCVSYGGLSFFTSCPIYEAISTVLPIGPMQLKINSQEKRIENIAFSCQDQIQKPGASNPIHTDILGNENYKWISAILFSKVHPGLLLDNVNEIPGITWGEINNDFVLVHNPVAEYPLTEKLFDTAATIRIEEGRLINEGKKIFPEI